MFPSCAVKSVKSLKPWGYFTRTVRLFISADLHSNSVTPIGNVTVPLTPPRFTHRGSMAKGKTSLPIDSAQVVGLFIESVFYGCVSTCVLFRYHNGSLDPIVISMLYPLLLFSCSQEFSWCFSSVL